MVVRTGPGGLNSSVGSPPERQATSDADDAVAVFIEWSGGGIAQKIPFQGMEPVHHVIMATRIRGINPGSFQNIQLPGLLVIIATLSVSDWRSPATEIAAPPGELHQNRAPRKIVGNQG